MALVDLSPPPKDAFFESASCLGLSRSKHCSWLLILLMNILKTTERSNTSTSIVQAVSSFEKPRHFEIDSNGTVRILYSCAQRS